MTADRAIIKGTYTESMGVKGNTKTGFAKQKDSFDSKKDNSKFDAL